MTIQQKLEQIEAALAQALVQYRDPAELYDPVHYVLSAGGKRIRPLLVLLATEAVGGETTDAMNAALAIEMLHNFTLVHDDIMDRSSLRRGRATAHIQFDENSAILSGDVIVGIASKLLSASAQHSHNPSAVFEVFSQGFIDVCEGQALDVAFTKRTDVHPDEYFGMIERKTARLLETSVHIGALVGNGDLQHTNALRTFARDIGLAFQMQDDILDVEGSHGFGKTPGGDLIEGKRTWLMLRAHEKATDTPEFHELVQTFFLHNGIAPSQVDRMRAHLVQSGVLAEGTAMVEKLTEEAFVHLHKLPDSTARQQLEELATTLMERTT